MSPHKSKTDRDPEAETPLDHLLAQVAKAGKVATWVSGFALVLVSLMVAAEVLLRKFFSVTLGGMDEITGYVLAVSVSWTLAYALTEKAHIRIDVLYNLVSARFRGLLDLLSLASLTALMFTVTYWAGKLLLTTLKFGSTSNSALQTPLWIPQALWVAGFLFFSFTLLLLVLRAAAFVLRGNVSGVSQIVGIRSVADEVEEQSILPDAAPTTQG
ncbi:TRAP transporter small permease subunit [Leisingera daeponensis]|uniref:TRAP transporter small permease subunit n=1 Tax=Leisingera daeponensis TaxID=405746 RepID=UPI001C9374BD|nr:TRAP transporter small permease [Leisingera daeponensis]MBY6059540.1 TRAP transporter small permease [Leisingera daeponensis]